MRFNWATCRPIVAGSALLGGDGLATVLEQATKQGISSSAFSDDLFGQEMHAKWTKHLGPGVDHGTVSIPESAGAFRVHAPAEPGCLKCSLWQSDHHVGSSESPAPPFRHHNSKGERYWPREKLEGGRIKSKPVATGGLDEHCGLLLLKWPWERRWARWLNRERSRSEHRFFARKEEISDDRTRGNFR